MSHVSRTAPPAFHYWQIWTDEQGISRQSRCVLDRFEQQSMGGAAPQWNDVLGTCQATVMFTVLPAGWIGDWHENPKPQWIVPLSGRWFVESMDGQRVELGPGEVSFGGDQDCVADAHGHKGHRSGTLGEQPAVLMLVQLEQPTARGRPANAVDGEHG
ncbi:cupin domain-containing protein [Dyella jejuensis]|uniref:Cupin domain-containing protein n=1 Tax=Dyella jejuensis TaxID=1432009 RepID=A0ABW8JHT5_9GAMM